MPDFLGPQTNTIAEQWNPVTKDTDAYNALNESTQSKLATIVQNNPQVVKDPNLLYGFINQNKLNGNEVMNATKYLTAYGGLQNWASNQIGKNQAKSNGPGFWGSLAHSVSSTWDNLTKSLEGVTTGGNKLILATTSAGPGQVIPAPNIEDVAKGVVAGGEAAGVGVLDIAKRTALTEVELGTLGYYGPNGWNTDNAGFFDAMSTVKNAIMSVGNLANPFSSGNAFSLMSHNIAFYQSLAQRYGWGYTFGYMIPGIAAGALSDGAVSGVEEVGVAETDAALIQRGALAEQEGREITAEEKANYEAAVKRQEERQRIAENAKARSEAMSRARQVMSGNYEGVSTADANIIKEYQKTADSLSDPEALALHQEENGAKYEAALARASREPNQLGDLALRGISKGMQYTTKTIGGAFKAARLLGKPMTDVKLNAAYLTTQALAMSNPDAAKIWNNPYVREGVVIGADGRPMGTSGQMIAQYFGLDKGNMFFSPVSGLTDFYTKWLGSDPLGAYGHVLGQARSFAGFSGKLGEWFGGLGIKSADDIYRATDQYDRVRRAFQFMADHSAVEIADAFRNTYADDTVKNISQAEILNRLGEATTMEEVMRIHADIAESTAIVKGTVPTMTAYEVFKAQLKGDLGKRFGILGNMLGADGAFLDEVAQSVLSETGIPMKPNSELLWVANDANLRGLNSFSRWMATRFTRSQMYIDDISKAVENRVIRPGSTNAIPAIMDMLRSALMPEAVVKGVGDMLLKSTNPQDYINAYRNAMYHVVMRRATAGLDHAEMTTFMGTASDHIWDEIVRMTGIDGGGNKGLYVAGINGEDLSVVYESEAKIEGYAGLGLSHLGELRFPRAAELKGLANEVRGFMHTFTNTEAADFARARAADLETLRSVVNFHNPTVRGLSDDIALNAPESLKELEVHGEKAKNGYVEASDRIKEDLAGIAAEKEMLEPEKFVRSYDMLRQGLFGLEPKINALAEMIRISRASVGEEVYAKAVNDVMETFPNANANNVHEILAGLMGQKKAYQDALRSMETRMTGPATPMRQLRKEMNEYLTATSDKITAEKILKNGKKMSASAIKAIEKNGTKAEKRELSLLMKMGAERQEDGSLFLSGYQQRINEWHLEKNPYLSTFQTRIDGLNRILNKTFVPLALLSGGWALRVSASEAMLNTLRFGGWESFDAKVMRSIAKHEINTGFENTGRATQLVRDIVAGALLGVEKAIVSGMDDERRARMLDDFVGTIMRHDGHLPMGVHSSTNDVFNDKTIDEAGAGMVTGIDAQGNPVLSQAYRDKNFASTDIGSPGYITALMENIKRISYDGLMNPVAKRLSDILEERGIANIGGEQAAAGMSRETLIAAGTDSYRTPEKIEELRVELEKSSLDAIEQMDPSVRQRFQRDTGRVKQGSKFARNSAHEEWAAALTEHVLSSVSGEGKDFLILHPSLIDQAATGDIKAVGDFTKDVHFMPKGSEPKHVPAPGFAHSAMKDGSASDFLKRISDKGHDKILGPIVNKLVREHTFLLEQHNAMEALRGLVDNNIISEETAQVLADQRAMTNMVKYVHNPKDKTLWEENMRVAAPFYFAQNQAWRRAFRVMRDNPGAFEKYLKLSLGVTNYISRASAGGNFPSVAIPGSQFMGMVGSAGSNTPGLSTSPSVFNNLGFGLSADPGSVSSVFPTGAEGGIAGMLGLARPSWGPIVTVPIKAFERMYGVDHHPLMEKILTSLLGPVSSSSSLYSDLFPSTVGRNVIDMAVALTGTLGFGYSTDAMNSAENYIINDAVDNLYKEQVNKVFKSTDFSGTNPATGKPWTHDEIMTYCRGQADKNITNLFDNHEYYQTFLDHAHAAAIAMTLVKAIISFGSPVAVSIQSQFGKNAQFQAIQKSIDPTTGKTYTYDAAVKEFTRRYPDNILDLVAHSANVNADYPETLSAVRLLSNAPGVAQSYPNAAAYLINRNTAYSPQAYQLELSMGLRSKEAPQNYLNSLLVGAGNDYYYNYLAVQPEFGGNNDKAPTQTTYAQYTALAAEAKQYGRTSNPTWYSEFTGATRFNHEIQAYKEMTNLLNDKSVPTSVLSKSDRSRFQDLMSQYNQVASEVTALKAAGNKTDAAQLRDSWYNWVTTNANDSYYTNQSYFMTSVLRGLPTV